METTSCVSQICICHLLNNFNRQMENTRSKKMFGKIVEECQAHDVIEGLKAIDSSKREECVYALCVMIEDKGTICFKTNMAEVFNYMMMGV